MFLPNKLCYIRKCVGHNIYGESLLGKKQLTKCAIVKLIGEHTKTTVRSDVGASKSHAVDQTEDAVILLPPLTKVNINDVIDVADTSIKITGIHPRYNIYGKLEHLECRGVFNGS